jgi:hypothetical protein
MKQIYPESLGYGAGASYARAAQSDAVRLSFGAGDGQRPVLPIRARCRHRHIKELGGVTHQYLTHWHEAAPGLARIKETFRSKLACHRLAEAAVSKFSSVDVTFPRREVHFGDIEVMKDSLAMLRSVGPDVVLCGASVADVPFKAKSRAEWHTALEQAARSLREDAVGNQPTPGAAP